MKESGTHALQQLNMPIENVCSNKERNTSRKIAKANSGESYLKQGTRGLDLAVHAFLHKMHISSMAIPNKGSQKDSSEGGFSLHDVTVMCVCVAS